MGINATTAGFTNTGHDLHIALVNADGTTIALENVMQFDAKQETQDVTRVRLDNRVLVADLPKLWSGTITYDRGRGNVDNGIAEIEQSWFSGKDYALGRLEISVSSSSGAGGVTNIAFLDVSLKQTDSGTWRGDDATSCRLEFRAARRSVNGVGVGNNSFFVT
jgi:uncharacterized protein YhdP